MSKKEDNDHSESVSHSSINVLNNTNIDVKEDKELKKCQQFELDNLNKGNLYHLKPIKISPLSYS